jgi:uncharacterized protein YjdB
MFKKSLLLTLLLALLVPWAANAQETQNATLYNGTANNSYVPMYTSFCDDGFTSEYIIPASAFANENIYSGSQLHSITLYQQSTSAWVAKDLTIKLTNTVTESYSSASLLGGSGTTVYTISSYSANSASSHTYEFSSSFEYLGGSLIVQISAASGGTWKGSSWYGTTTTTNQGYYIYGSTTGSLQKFIPKTTFNYTPSTNPSIALNPTSAFVLTGSTQELTATTVNVTGTPTITYTSNNESVATVSGNGTSATVTGVAEGTATITATMTYNATDYTATCDITVADACQPTWSGSSSYYISKFVANSFENSSTGTALTTTNYYSTKSIAVH